MTQAETRTCRTCSSQFPVDSDDFAFYERMAVPAPALCPDCRLRRRMAWRNERTLYKRDCDLCGKSMITMFSPDSPYTVYCQPCWYSDKWDPQSYAREYDPGRPFFEQLQELALAVPKCGLYITSAMGPVINTEYANFVGATKDCYLIFNSSPAEGCAYSRGLSNCRDVYDSYFADGAERIYEGVNAEKSSGVAFGQNIADCLDSWFLRDCVGSQKCFGCVNLRHGSNQFFNEQLSKEDWQARVEPLLGSYAAVEDVKSKFEEHSLKFPRRENTNFKCVNSTGNYLIECKNCLDCHEVAGGENMRYCFSAKFAKDCYDIMGHGRKAELFLETVAAGVGNRVIGAWWAEASHDIEYSLAINGSEYCFGCDGLKKGSYCILNKTYEPAEYKRLREQIVAELSASGDYGLFFPPAMSPFAYNESIGQDYMPLDRSVAESQGYRWQDNIPETKGKETLKTEDIPDRIQDVKDSILDEILACAECSRNYRLIRQELEMYRKALIPIPRKCFNCRHRDRLRRRGSFTLYDRSCAKCSRAIRTSYSPEGPETVYCEACYQNEVV